jgi:hypothetical protein
MKSGNIKTKNSRIPVLPRLAWRKRRLASLWKIGMVLIGLIFAGFVFAQIPYEEGKVYVCPLATKMEEINPKCDCRIDLILGETVTSTCGTTTYEMTLTITEYEGNEYYAILGFENGGAGVNFEPEAKILTPSEGYVGQEVLFDGSQSFDPNDDPLDFYWDFGDGSTSTGEKISHIYQIPGEYLVALTVDDRLASTTATTTIKILSPSLPSSAGGFVYFGKEKEVPKEEEEKRVEGTQPKEITEELEKPKEITKILKIEKPEKIEEESKKETPLVPVAEKIETKTTPQNFAPFLLASLREIITTPQVLIFSLFSIFILVFILIKEIKVLKRK